MIDQRVAILRAHLAAATPPPWVQTGTAAKPHWYVAGPDVLVHRLEASPDTTPETLARWTADAALIAAARNALPALLDIAVAASEVLRYHIENDCIDPQDCVYGRLAIAVAALEAQP
jgi:hypothetical protein